MKLPTWFSRSKTAPTIEEFAAKLTEAEAASAAAIARVDEARQALATERTATAAEALRAAKLEADDTAELVTILRADHAAAAAEHDANERAALERLCQKLEAELEAPDAEMEALLNQQIQAALSFARAFALRQARGQAQLVRREQLDRALVKLGLPETTTQDVIRAARPHHPRAEIIDSMRSIDSEIEKLVLGKIANLVF